MAREHLLASYIEWHQHDSNSIYVKWLDKPMQVYRTGNEYMVKTAMAHVSWTKIEDKD